MMRKPEEPAGWVGVGVMTALVGGGVNAFAIEADLFGLWFVAGLLYLLGGIMTQAGVIAIGVRLGMRWSRWEQQTRDSAPAR